jgi:type I site-specific restriction-modification system R (restriction) subunit
MSKDKKPDLAVWSEQNGYYAKTLTYGTNLGAPSIKLENVAGCKQAQAEKVNDIVKLQERKTEIENQRVKNVLAYSAAINAYDEAAKTLPQGSPELARLKKAEEDAKKTRRDYLLSSYKELEQDINKKLKALTG